MKIIVFSFIISFLGSLPPGVINLTVVNLTSAGFLFRIIQFVLISLIAELIHISLAFLILPVFESIPAINTLVKIGSFIFLIIPGILTLIKSNKGPLISNSKNFYGNAILINILNPAAIPFWIFYITYLRQYFMVTDLPALNFSIGAIAGTTLTLLLYAFLGIRLYSNFQTYSTYVNKAMGILMLILGCLGILKIWI